MLDSQCTTSTLGGTDDVEAVIPSSSHGTMLLDSDDGPSTSNIMNLRGASKEVRLTLFIFIIKYE